MDIAFTRRKVAVFVDGCFWHGCPQHMTWPVNNAAWWQSKIEDNWARDADTEHLLEKQGWLCVRVWEHEDVLMSAERVEAVLLGR